MSLDSSQWNALLAEAKAGNAGSLNRLCVELEVRLRQFAVYRLWKSPPAVVDDLVQEALTAFAEKYMQIESNPNYWAVQAFNFVLSHYFRGREVRKHESLNAQEADDGGAATALEAEASIAAPVSNAHDLVERDELRTRMARALIGMSPFCREFFRTLLHGRAVADYWDVCRNREPALQRSAFDKRIFDCRRRLRQQVREYGQ